MLTGAQTAVMTELQADITAQDELYDREMAKQAEDRVSLLRVANEEARPRFPPNFSSR